MPFVSVCCFSIPLHKQWKMSVSSVTELSCVDENVNSQPFIIVFLGKNAYKNSNKFRLLHIPSYK